MPLTVLTLESRVMDRICPGDPKRFQEMLSEAEEKLLEAGRWRWTRNTIELIPVDGRILLPAQYLSIAGARIGCRAVGVLWEENAYTEDGPSMVCIEGCHSQLVDAGVVSGQRAYDIVGGNVSSVDKVTVLAKYAPVTYTATSQTLLCPSFSALKLALFSLAYENENDLDRMAGYLQQAIGTLNRKEEAYRGIAKKVNTVKLFGPIPRASRTQIR